MELPPHGAKEAEHSRRGHAAVSSGTRYALLLGLAIACGVGLRLTVRLPSGLWEDEIIAVTHAEQPLPYFFVNVMRNDVHPPLYFLQLHVWSLVSHADLWFVANSVAWGLAAMASLWLVMRRICGDTAAWTAVACLAVLPSGLWMSQEIRPYAWLSVLLIWAYALAHRCFSAPAPRRRALLLLLGLCLLITYSHAIGFVAVLFNGLFALGLLVRRRAPRREALAWLAVYAVAAVASLPILATNLVHDANLGGSASLQEVVSWLPASIFGNEMDSPVWLFGLVAYCGIAGFGLANARTRLLAGCFLVAPLLVAAGLAAGLKPIFKANFFATLMAPFFAIVAAELILSLRRPVRIVGAAGILAGLLALSVAGWAGKKRSTDFLPAATDIRAGLQSGDAVYVPQNVVFWGVARYLAGPDWGSPLAVANSPSSQWQGVYARLGPRLVNAMHLLPTTQEIGLPGGASMIIGNDSAPLAEQHRRVWLVTYPRVDAPAGYPPDRLGPLKKTGTIRYSLLEVSLYVRDP